MDPIIEKHVLLEMEMVVNYGWIQHSKYNKNIDCVICLDNLQNGYVLETVCGHVFHYNCLLVTLEHYNFFGCPQCKKLYELSKK